MTTKYMPARSRSIHTWWDKNPNEIFWLEVTGRSDIGVNLKAPQANEHGADFWSYSLLKYVHQGNVIFHYDRNKQAIVAQSIATGELWIDNITWAARGAYAREAGIQPHTRPGWYVGLEDFKQLKTPLELDLIRAFHKEIFNLMSELTVEVGLPLYFPFEMGTVRPMRPMQGYLFKLPFFFTKLFKELLGEYAFKSMISDSKIEGNIGAEYRSADEETSVGERDPFSIDPAIVERGLRSHAATQNALADFLKNRQLLPLSPGPNEPSYDIAWKHNDKEIWIAEIKSVTNANEEKQLRLGLGQVLRYCHLLKTMGSIHGVLVIERAPSDQTWIDLCEAHNILLVWPEIFPSKIRV